MISRDLLSVVRFAISGGGVPEINDWDSLMADVRTHAIIPILFLIKDRINVPEKVIKQIKTEQYKYLAQNTSVMREQQKVVDALENQGIIPFILKGSALAQYYDIPKSRTVGDIDLLVADEEKFNTAIKEILKLGFYPMEEYGEMNFKNSLDSGFRHYEFKKNNIEVELHSTYTKTQSPVEIYLEESEPVERHIESLRFHSFSDIGNGLVILQHINYHLAAAGIGLRLLIDWAYYVKNILTDVFWDYEFREVAERCGFLKLAVCLTRVCEMYFEIGSHKYSECADDALCEDFMQLVLESGNFGRNRTITSRKSSEVKADNLLRNVQNKGLSESKAIQKYKVLQPFAWVYGLYLYTYQVLKSDKGIRETIKGQKYGKKIKKIQMALEIS